MPAVHKNTSDGNQDKIIPNGGSSMVLAKEAKVPDARVDLNSEEVYSSLSDECTEKCFGSRMCLFPLLILWNFLMFDVLLYSHKHNLNMSPDLV